jgi:hypothetical protein
MAASLPGEKPPLPYYDWNACPFECCTYRTWKVNQTVTAYASRNEKAAIVFQAKRGEWVRGTTGVVITKRYGLTKILKPLELGYRPKSRKPELFLQPGTVVYTLHYTGEGMGLFWYNGSTYVDQIAARDPDPDPPPPDLNVQVVSLPSYDWWVKIKNNNGLEGWTRETRKFGNMDACG